VLAFSTVSTPGDAAPPTTYSELSPTLDPAFCQVTENTLATHCCAAGMAVRAFPALLGYRSPDSALAAGSGMYLWKSPGA